MISLADINKNKVNKYLMELFMESPLDETSSFWQVIINFLNMDVFMDAVDVDLAFASRYIIFKNDGGSSSSSSTKQASISVGHLSISGLSGSDVAGGGVNMAREIYNSLLLNSGEKSFFLQFNEETKDCGCGGLSD